MDRRACRLAAAALLLSLLLCSTSSVAATGSAAGEPAAAQEVTADRFRRYPYPPAPAPYAAQPAPGAGGDGTVTKESEFVVDAAGDAVVQGARAVGDTSGAAPGAEQGWEDAVAAVLQSIAQKQDQPANVGLSSPSHLIEMMHVLWGGRSRYCQGIRLLVAGGGTGEKTLQLASQLRDVGAPHEIVHVDSSGPAIAAARERLGSAGLPNVVFLHKPIEALNPIDDGVFDYIDCEGVVHHTADPARAMKALRALLHPRGGMALAVYGADAREGVRRVQRLLDLLYGGTPEAPVPANRTTLLAARQVLGALPRTHPLQRDEHTWRALAQAVETMGEAGVADLFLPGIEHVYTVDDFRALVDASGFCLAQFVPPAVYWPETFASQPGNELQAALQWLGPWERARAAELLSGNHYHHMAYLRPRGEGGCSDETPPTADESHGALYPVPFHYRPRTMAEEIAREGHLVWRHHTLPLDFQLSTPARAALLWMDGYHTLSEVANALRGQSLTRPWEAIEEAFRVLNSIGRIHLADAPLRRGAGVDCTGFTPLECRVAEMAYEQAGMYYTVPLACSARKRRAVP